MKDKNHFKWIKECEKAFKELKTYLGLPLLFVKPIHWDVLQSYLFVLDYAVSLVLVKNVWKEQKLIFYDSRAFLDAKTRYTHIEKLVYALVISLEVKALLWKSCNQNGDGLCSSNIIA